MLGNPKPHQLPPPVSPLGGNGGVAFILLGGESVYMFHSCIISAQGQDLGHPGWIYSTDLWVPIIASSFKSEALAGFAEDGAGCISITGAVRPSDRALPTGDPIDGQPPPNPINFIRVEELDSLINTSRLQLFCSGYPPNPHKAPPRRSNVLPFLGCSLGGVSLESGGLSP